MKTKLISFLALFIVLFTTLGSSAFAVTMPTEDNTSKVEANKTTLEVVDKSICEMDLDNMGHFRKELTHFDVEKRELTITLTVNNTANVEEAEKPVEVFLVLDNYNSMT